MWLHCSLEEILYSHECCKYALEIGVSEQDVYIYGIVHLIILFHAIISCLKDVQDKNLQLGP